MKNILLLIVFLTWMFSCSEQRNRIDLSGEWRVKIDSVYHTVVLPGSLAENRVGVQPTDSLTNRLTETYHYEGAALYEKEVMIPSSWVNRPVELYIERSKVSELYMNGKPVGRRNSVSTPHVYRIDSMFEAGKNQIAIKVDNTKNLLPLGGSHAYSEHTQTNWNGILGDFYLRMLPNISIRQIRIDSSVDGHSTIRVSLFNHTQTLFENEEIRITIKNKEGKIVSHENRMVNVIPGDSEHAIETYLSNPDLWDEYSPALYTFQVDVGGDDTKIIHSGIRDFSTRGTQFVNNGRTVFLRGKNECGIFPITGYASMEVDDWKRYFSIVRSYGLNHVRFHSWTPPEAAFVAADEIGVFLQPELPLWGTYHESDTTLISYMMQEGYRIMEEYGNHPSFVMLSLGNELEGDTVVMARVVRGLKEVDNRPLYALGTNNHYWNPQTHPEEDFFVAMRQGEVAPNNSTDLRGSFSFADSDQGGIINSLPPDTYRNFSSANQNLGKPAIGHETGQYQVYPDFKEIDKYCGVLRPLNLMIFKKRLKQSGMGEQAEAFLKASGALAALCYREEIEMALRTPDFGGFQLLDLQDYPGQGTALVGILDAFMESKGVVSREKWTEFCRDIVPLARFPKYCWYNDEVFTAKIQIAHYGQTDIIDERVTCSLSTASGETFYSKDIHCPIISQGRLNSVVTLDIPLNEIGDPAKITFEIAMKETGLRNSWDIWVYPRYDSKTPIAESSFDGVVVTRDKALFEKLYKSGSPVLYIPMEEDVLERSVGGLFTTDFWNYNVFKGVAESLGKEPSPGTLGLLINDPGHGIFNSFPTDYHASWQWWHIVKNSRPIILDNMPAEYLPIVQVIDNFDRNHKLGLIYQLPGSSALVCSSDLFACSDEPEVNALFHSLLEYLKEKE
ncbi:MAG TPA: hypothetical protein DEP83_02175 [Porphyromonadaceae bacterium]|nr:hypothetical protein [Porphyromonadaceae bacterium]